MRHLLDTTEFNKDELHALIALGREMKANPAAFRTGLAGKNIVTLFENSLCVPESRLILVSIASVAMRFIWINRMARWVNVNQSKTSLPTCPAGVMGLLLAYLTIKRCKVCANTRLFPS